MRFRRSSRTTDTDSERSAAAPPADASGTNRADEASARSIGTGIGRCRVAAAISATVVAVGAALWLGGVGYARGAVGSVASSITGGHQATTQSVTPQDDALTDGDFLISVEPGLEGAGSHAAWSGRLRVIEIGDYPYWVTISASVAPKTPSIKIAFPADLIHAGLAADFTVSTTDAATGFYVVTITGTGHGGIVRTATLRLNVA